MDIAELWDICIKFMWDSSYIRSLDSLFRKNNIKTILDCGGGTGFLSLELKKLGWNITYSDSNKLMFEHFEKKLEASKLRIPHFLINWTELSTEIKQKFDVVLCRGNSLIYVDSWDKNKISGITKEKIKKALQEFYNKLNNGGFLYIDLINKKEFDKSKYPIIEEFGEKIIDGKKIKLTWELTHDYKRRIRTWKSVLVINGQKREFVYYSYLLRHEELISLLRQVGFNRIEEAKINGEDNYNVYIAYK